MILYRLLFFVVTFIPCVFSVSSSFEEMQKGCFKTSLRNFGLKFNLFLVYRGGYSFDIRVVPDDRDVARKRLDSHCNVCDIRFPENTKWYRFLPQTAPEVLKKSMNYMSISEIFFLAPLEGYPDSPSVDFITPWSSERSPITLKMITAEEDDIWGDCFFECSRSEMASYRPQMERTDELQLPEDPDKIREDPLNVVGGQRPAEGKFMRELVREMLERKQAENGGKIQIAKRHDESEEAQHNMNMFHLNNDSTKLPEFNAEKFHEFNFKVDEVEKQLTAIRSRREEEAKLVAEYYLHELPEIEGQVLKEWKEKEARIKIEEQQNQQRQFRGDGESDDDEGYDELTPRDEF
eukprot:GDKJ01021951.1.p1 GENE.GDKJ01021951.1~~GDKJ01021951.1.p1  ORF type:complete len:349 (-),score=63.95 GDKJ01021951.1:910-1956(-)